jgi:hypothetical protein
MAIGHTAGRGVCGDFVMFDTLRSPDQSGFQNRPSVVFFTVVMLLIRTPSPEAYGAFLDQ